VKHLGDPFLAELVQAAFQTKIADEIGCLAATPTAKRRGSNQLVTRPGNVRSCPIRPISVISTLERSSDESGCARLHVQTSTTAITARAASHVPDRRAPLWRPEVAQLIQRGAKRARAERAYVESG
jgi:hypothetical protein